MKLPKVGTKAPAFKLLNQNEEAIELKSLKGKIVVLYFYPRAMTPGCTTQACGMRDYKKKWASLNATVLGVSPDEPGKLKKFQEKEGLNFDLLSDPDHKTAEMYGVWGLKKFMGKEYMGIHRITFIIGEDGKIKHIMDDVKTKTHNEDILNILE